MRVVRPCMNICGRQFLWIFRHVYFICMCVCVCQGWRGTPEQQDARTIPFVECAVIMAILPHDDALGYLVIWPNQAIYSQLSSTPPSAAIVWKSICVIILTVHFPYCHYTHTHAHLYTCTQCTLHNKSRSESSQVTLTSPSHGQIWFMHISIWFISLASLQNVSSATESAMDFDSRCCCCCCRIQWQRFTLRVAKLLF